MRTALQPFKSRRGFVKQDRLINDRLEPDSHDNTQQILQVGAWVASAASLLRPNSRLESRLELHH